MSRSDPLQAYALRLVALGQAALERRRRGAALPDDLASLADHLLALEEEIGAALAAPEPDDSQLAADRTPRPLAEPALPEELGLPPDSDGRPNAEAPTPAGPVPLPDAPGACANCGVPLRAGKRFCYNCGVPLSPGDQPAAAQG